MKTPRIHAAKYPFPVDRDDAALAPFFAERRQELVDFLNSDLTEPLNRILDNLPDSDSKTP